MMMRDMTFKKLLRSRSGFTLVEVLTVTLIMGFLLASAMVGFSVFAAKFKEISRWIELQKDAFETLQTIKNGVSIGYGQSQLFYGVVNSNKLELRASGFGGGSDRLVCYPGVDSESHANDKIEFYFDGRAIKYQYVYGPTSSPTVDLFPSRKQREYIQVQSFKIRQYNNGPEVKAIKLELSARINTSKNRYRYVNYSTIMAIR